MRRRSRVVGTRNPKPPPKDDDIVYPVCKNCGNSFAIKYKTLKEDLKYGRKPRCKDCIKNRNKQRAIERQEKKWDRQDRVKRDKDIKDSVRAKYPGLKKIK